MVVKGYTEENKLLWVVETIIKVRHAILSPGCGCFLVVEVHLFLLY